MKKIATLCFLLSQILVQAQEKNILIPPCGSDNTNKQILQDSPETAERIAAFETAVQNRKQAAKGSSTTVYQIPVVVHVMHLGESIGTGTNISDAAIKSKIRIMNEDYRKIAGTGGDGKGVDMQVEFVLAVIDPNGNQTSGIDRYNMSSQTAYKNNGVNNLTTSGISEAKLKSLAVWDQSTYYNIWVVSEIDNNSSGNGIQAWAIFPASPLSTLDGAVVLSTRFGDTTSTVETHELGHALNLYHTFTGDNPSNNGTTFVCPSTDPTQGDFCADTPPHIRNTSDCSASTNSCNPTNASDVSYLNNYMNYTLDPCRNMFTANQKDRAMTTLTTMRASLFANTNNITPNAAPTADFIPNTPVLVTVGSSLLLSDASIGVPNNYLNYNSTPGMSFNWTVTNGTTTLTSTDQNPIFTFTETGRYDITHEVNNGIGTDTKTLAQVIYVIDAATELPSNTLKSTSNGGFLIDYVNLNTISKITTATTNTPYIDYINTDKTILVAGATYTLNLNVKSGSSYYEWYTGYIDYNNDGVFSETERLGSSYTNANSTVPVTIPLGIKTTGIAMNQLLRMRIAGNASNATSGATAITNAMINGTASFHIGDVKDFGVYVIDKSQALAVDDFLLENLTYFPNPAKDVLNINHKENIDKVEIYNITGQMLVSENFQDSNIQLNISQLTPGAYIATVYVGDKKASIKILKN